MQWVSEFCDRQDLAALSLKDTSEEGRNSVRRAFELLAQLSGELIANAENVWDSDWECVAAQLRSVLPSCQNGLRRYLDDGVRALEERLQHSSAPMDFPERDRYR